MSPTPPQPVESARRRRQRPGASVSALLLALVLLAPAPVAAQSLDTVITVSSGTGLSLGQGQSGTGARRSPAFLAFDVGLRYGDPTLEWTVGMLLELEGRVSVAVDPSLKKVKWLGSTLALYARAGLPFFFAPFSLIGAEAAVGGILRIASIGLVLELRGHVYFAGSDLADGAVLAKLDAALGVRFDL